MAEIKHILSLMRKRQKKFLKYLRRLARALAQFPPHRVALIFAPRPTRRVVRNVTKFEIGGNITRSFILALPQVHVESINIKAIVGGVVIIIVVVNVATSMTPNPGKNALPAFVHGDPYHLDMVIAPFRAVNPSDKACGKFAQDFSDRLAGAVTNSDLQRVLIWLPEQVTGALAQDGKDGVRIDQFAEVRQVDALFYGEIECDAQKATVRPRMIVPALFYRGAPEMEGFYNFDDMIRPLAVEMGNDALEHAAYEQAERISLFIDIGRGLRLMMNNSIEELKQATVLFQRLAQAGNITDRHGLAMLQYLAGKAQLTAAADECNQVDQTLLRQAEDSFSRALLHEPEFALALVNLGHVSINQARILMENDADGMNIMLNKSLSRFERALNAQVQPADGLAIAMAKLGEAQAWVALHDADPMSNESRQLLAQATETLNDLIAEFDHAGAAKEIQAVMATAYTLMGDLQRAGFNDERALSSYSKVAFLTENRRLKAAVAQSMAELYTVRGDACAAALQYQMAAQTSCLADGHQFAAQAERMQFYCQQNNDAQTR